MEVLPAPRLPSSSLPPPPPPSSSKPHYQQHRQQQQAHGHSDAAKRLRVLNGTGGDPHSPLPVVPHSPLSTDGSDYSGMADTAALTVSQPADDISGLDDFLDFVIPNDFGGSLGPIDYDQTFVDEPIQPTMMDEEPQRNPWMIASAHAPSHLATGSETMLGTAQPLFFAPAPSHVIGAEPSTATAVVAPVSSRIGIVAPAEERPQVITITNEPSQFGRFRYKSEKREKCLEGANDGSAPEVMVAGDILRHASQMAITASLVTRDGRPHWHELQGTINMRVTPSKSRYAFDNLSVIMDKGAGLEKNRNKDDQRAVRIKFVLTYTLNGRNYSSTVISKPVYNAKMAITHLSHTHGQAVGGNEVIILCSKIRKTTTAVKIRDVNYGSGQKLRTSETHWEHTPPEMPFTIVHSNKLQSHHQVALILTMPAFHTIDITHPHEVDVSIIDVEDETESQPIRYTYLQSDATVRDERNEQKRRRVQDDMNDFSGRGPSSSSSSGSARGNGSSSSRRSGRRPSPDNGSGGGAANGDHMEKTEPMDEADSMEGQSPAAEPAESGTAIDQLEALRESVTLQTDMLRFFAATGDMSLLLAALRPSLARVDDDGDLPLHLAIRSQNASACLKIIETMTPADLDLLTGEGETALHMAAAQRMNDVCSKLLVFGADLAVQDSRGRNALHWAAAQPSATTFEALLAACPTPEMRAAALAQVDYDGITPLHYAARHALPSSIPITARILQLLPAGLVVSQRDLATGRYAIHMAAQMGDVELARCFLSTAQTAADSLQLRDYAGLTPLHYAAAANHTDMAAFLLQHGADPRLLSERGESVFQLAFTSIAGDAKPMLHTLATVRATSAHVKVELARDDQKQLVKAVRPAVPGKAIALASKLHRMDLASPEPIEDNWVINDFDDVPSHEALAQSSLVTSSLNMISSMINTEVPFLSQPALAAKNAIVRSTNRTAGRSVSADAVAKLASERQRATSPQPAFVGAPTVPPC